MDTAAALLTAIRAAPDDDDPRLVYADWLEENDQPERAEFIRVQIALHNSSAGPKRKSLQRRERELLRQYANVFAGSLDVYGLRFRYQRGFIDRIETLTTYRYDIAGHSYFVSFRLNGLADTGSVVLSRRRGLVPLMSQFQNCSPYLLLPSETGAQVRLASTGPEGTVDSVGIIEGKTMLLDTHNRINGHRERQRYFLLE